MIEILINVRPNQTRVAYVEDQQLADLKIERNTQPTLVGSVFKGKVLRVLPGMQAAFVDIGLDRSGFLYVGDVLENIQASQLLLKEEKASRVVNDGEPEERPHNTNHAKVPIQKLLTSGQEILVQVSKDPLGTKGARITSQISLPGRNLVYMPNIDHIGVSRKIESSEEGVRLRKEVESLGPKGGVIVRTAGEGASKESLKSDLNYLERLWEEIEQNYRDSPKLGLVYSDMDVELRALRDLLDDKVSRVFVDNKEVFSKINKFVERFLPQHQNKVELYESPKPLFDLYDLDIEVSRSLQRKIWLKSGGYIIIDEAEALVVVDVNTGRFVGKKNLESTILKTNLEAVREIAHQLRIRNCGGIVVLDLIDMESEVNREKVVYALEEELKADRAKTAVISMSSLGLVEMTRKRTRPSLVSSLCEPCSYCDGKAYVKTKSTVANEIFAALERGAQKAKQGTVAIVQCYPDVADWIYEEESETLEFVENKLGDAVVFKIEVDFHIEEFVVKRIARGELGAEVGT